MTATRISGLGGIVVCGGRSSRMGSAKAWLDVEGEPMLTRIVRRLQQVAHPIVVVASPDQSLPDLPEDSIVTHDVVADRGPLQGMAAGFEALVGRATAVFVSSTDAPLIHPVFVATLARLRETYDAVVPRDEGHLHPLSAVYAIEVRHAIDELLRAGGRRVMSLFDHVRARVVDRAELLADPELAAADPPLASLLNVNTPAEYASAMRAILGA